MGGVEGHAKAQKQKGKDLMKDILQLCDIVRETGYAAHRYLRNGHVEKVYENSLANRLRKKGLKVIQQHPLIVPFRGY